MPLPEIIPDRKKDDQQNMITIKGKVVDAETRNPLVFATVAVMETNVAIVTNIDGEFTLKIGETVTSKNLEVTYLGYKNKVIPISDLKDNGGKNIIELESAPIPIKEIVVKPLDPDEIVKKAIQSIGKNYEDVAKPDDSILQGDNQEESHLCIYRRSCC